MYVCVCFRKILCKISRNGAAFAVFSLPGKSVSKNQMVLVKLHPMDDHNYHEPGQYKGMQCIHFLSGTQTLHKERESKRYYPYYLQYKYNIT